MEKIWKNNYDGTFSFLSNGATVGTFDDNILKKSSRAKISIGNDNFTIVRKGFWKSKLIILDENKDEVLTLTPLNWYSSSNSVVYNNQKYVLKIGNNPLTQWSIYQDSDFILSYGLAAAKGKIALKISELAEAPVTLHFLLWYLIKPVIFENNGQDEELMLYYFINQ